MSYEELRVLRGFRDEVILSTALGRAEVAEYYQLAPEVMGQINERSDAGKVYFDFFQRHIAPAVQAVKCGNKTVAYSIFRQLVRELKLLRTARR